MLCLIISYLYHVSGSQLGIISPQGTFSNVWGHIWMSQCEMRDVTVI
jgi:hypothetical protein